MPCTREIPWTTVACLVLVGVLSSCTALKPVGGQPNEGGAAEAGGFARQDFLTTRGTQIVTRGGKPVVLRGLNLGGWLLQTIYMSPMGGTGIRDETDIYRTLGERFGADGRRELLDTYHASFITADDLDRIARTGANAVRVPFWWRSFMDEDGGFIAGTDGRPDFGPLDFIVEECSRRGIYVILDLHGAPGSQNGHHYSGIETSDPTLFADTSEGTRSRELTTKLWRAIAEHFRGNPAVAGYDLLNEPYWTGVIGPLDRWRIWAVYDEIYGAIRDADPDHIIIMESSWNIDSLPDPKGSHGWKSHAWTNVVYSDHYYPKASTRTTAARVNAFASRLKKDLKTIEEYQVPLYIGELNYHSDWEAWEGVLSQLDQDAISYTVWSYKCTHSDQAVWGVMYRSLVPKADIGAMTFDEIMAVFAKTTGDSLGINEDGIRTLCRHFGGDPNDFGLSNTAPGGTAARSIALSTTLSLFCLDLPRPSVE